MRYSFLLFFLPYLTLIAQDLPKDYYQFPIRPGEQNYLAGTVGEIRSSHFHTGIDVKTFGEVGLPIYAIADGFISRVKVSAYGYGNALYMQHPNGTFSVYAHLQAFDPEIEEYVLANQYEKESFEVNLFPRKGQIPFKKGQIIGYSGNSGSSTGPHLHFEIRDANQKPIDVLSLGFREIRDSRAPVATKIAFVTLDENARVNNSFGRFEFDLVSRDKQFRMSSPVQLTGKIGIEIYSYDPMNDVNNKNGIVHTTMSVDGKMVFEEKKEKLSFGQQRNVLKHYNYGANKLGSRRFNRLYKADGNKHDMYSIVNRGVVFKGGEEVFIKMVDSYGNTSKIFIEADSASSNQKPKTGRMKVIENYMHFSSDQQVSLQAEEWEGIKAYQTTSKEAFYLVDLRKKLPKALFKDGKTVPTNLVATIPSEQAITYTQKEFEAVFKSNTLFDTLYMAFSYAYDSSKNQELFAFQNPLDPLRSNVSLTLKPKKRYDPEKSAVFSVFGKSLNYQGGTWEEKAISFNTRDLVTYTIAVDTIPPTIKPIEVTSKKLVFKINDERAGIKSFRAEMDGQFVLMQYEPKRKIIRSKKLDDSVPFSGDLVLEVIDNLGNKTRYEKSFR